MALPPVDQLIEEVRVLGLPVIGPLLPALVQMLPLDALLRLAEQVAAEIEAKSEKEAVKAGLDAADAAADAAEALAVKGQ